MTEERIGGAYIEFSEKGGKALADKMADIVQGFQSLGKETAKAIPGVKLLGREFEKLANTIKKATASARAFANQLQQRFPKTTSMAQRLASTLGQGMKKALMGVNKLLTASAAAMTGFITAGVAASGMGSMFGFQMGRISRAIAGLFRPELEKILFLLSRFADKLETMDGPARSAVARFGKFAIVTKALGTALSFLLPGVGPIVKLLLSLAGGAAAAGSSMSGIGASLKPLMEGFKGIFNNLGKVLNPVVALLAEIFGSIGPTFFSILKIVIQGISALLLALVTVIRPILNVFIWIINKLIWLVNKLISAINMLPGADIGKIEQLKMLEGKQLAEDTGKGKRTPMGMAPGGFEGVEATWKRFAIASLKATAAKTVPEQQLDVLKSIEKGVAAGNEIVANQKPVAIGSPKSGLVYQGNRYAFVPRSS